MLSILFQNTENQGKLPTSIHDAKPNKDSTRMKRMGQYHLRMQIQKEKKKTDKIPAKNSCITVRKITHHD